ncbi:hypothetical protein P0082_02735 [Candidatus Haliotispira prima]|uniref:Lipoprotein n=1 Tax=Candidatus Haliotispira prima TaxID=3034016 RepID=A0ABY8MIE8_9SPIO|nr:hypothetical protein P0082_02735 [Candidatus Haliotispira prima]
MLSVLGLSLLACAPLPDTGDPPATPTPTKSITVNYSGLHYVHFTANDPNLSADKTVGFLITSTGSSPSKAEAEVKKGYITRKFTETKKARNVFMFLHEGTAYNLATGSTDISFVVGATASDTNFETSDILQENTSYKIRMYDGDTILEKTFTTKSFSDGDASSEGIIAYMGGLAAVSILPAKPTDEDIAAAKARVSLTIERKAEEIMLIPYANDNYTGEQINYYENMFIQGGCSPTCGTGVSGTYAYVLTQEANTLVPSATFVSSTYILSPQKKIISSSWTAREGVASEIIYNIEIISE